MLFKTFLIAFISAYSIFSQQYRFEKFGSKEGLVQSVVNDIFQDSKGFLWIATQDGLFRYDGYEFFRYGKSKPGYNGLSDSFVRSIYEHPLFPGILWIGTGKGSLNKFNMKSNKLSVVNNILKKNIENKYHPIWTVAGDKFGNLWIGTEGAGLIRYSINSGSTRSFTYENTGTKLNSNVIRTIFIDSAANRYRLLIGSDKGLSILNINGNNSFMFEDGISCIEKLKHNRIWTIEKDKYNSYWIGTEKGLYVLNKNFEITKTYVHDPHNAQSINSNAIWSLFKDSRGVMWVGTEGAGIYIYDGSRDSFKKIIESPGNPYSISGNFITDFVEDKSGNIWIGLWGGGINKYNPKDKWIEHYFHINGNDKSLLDNKVWSIVDDKAGYIWITTDKGLNKLNDKDYSIVSYPFKYLWALYEDHSGRLWCSNYGGGLLLFNKTNGSFTNFNDVVKTNDKLNSIYVSAIAEDRDNNLLVGTYAGGLNILDMKTGHIEYYTTIKNSNSISHNDIQTIFVDNNNIIWIGTNGGGLNKFEINNRQFESYVYKADDSTSISDNRVYSIYESPNIPGYLWIGTGGGGLNKFDKKEKIFVRYASANGLSDNIIYGILEDDEGFLWLSSNNGLIRFNPHSGDCNKFTSLSGLQDVEFNSGAYCKTSKGDLIFGGVNGINIIHPRQFRINNSAPHIVFTEFRINNKSVNLKPSILFSDTLVLSYKDRLFSIKFSALEYTYPVKNNYKYKLEGFSDNWIESSSYNRNAVYTNLSPGEYNLKVIASNNDNIWNNKGASIHILITPPFWMTTQFYLLLGVLIIGFIYYLHIKSIRKIELARQNQQAFSSALLETQEAERKRISQELHDGLAQNLLIINNELHQSLNNKHNSGQKIKDVVRLIKETINDLRSISQNLHPYLIESVGLVKTIETLINKIQNSLGININLYSENIDELLPVNYEVHFYRIIQEALNNIIKHSNADEVELSINVEGNNIVVYIKDNGKGFIMDDRVKGLGLRDMHERAKIINGKIILRSEPGKGCTINLKAPFEPA